MLLPNITPHCQIGEVFFLSTTLMLSVAMRGGQILKMKNMRV